MLLHCEVPITGLNFPMAQPGTTDLMMTIYGLEVHGGEVDAGVFAEKLKKILTALKRLDTVYNTAGQHKFMINDVDRALDVAGVTVWLREKQIKPKRTQVSPARRFAEIGSTAAAGGPLEVQNDAENFALQAYANLSKGAGRDFSYGIIEAPEVAPVRLDKLMERRVREIIKAASDAAAAAPRKYFRGTAIETYDGVVKAVDLRGLFPEAKLILSAGGKREISCVVSREDVEMLRQALDVRALVTGRAQHDGHSMLPERIDVSQIKVIGSHTNVLSMRGALKGLHRNPMREVG